MWYLCATCAIIIVAVTAADPATIVEQDSKESRKHLGENVAVGEKTRPSLDFQRESPYWIMSVGDWMDTSFSERFKESTIEGTILLFSTGKCSR